MKKYASVVIPSHNEGDYLLWTVTNVLQSVEDEEHADAIEVIVVDDRSEDGSGQDVADTQADGDRVKVLFADQRLGVVGARNVGARHATGKYLVFVDAHTQPSDSWLSELLAPFDDAAVGVTTAALMALNAEPTNGATPRAQGAQIEDARLRYGYPAPRPTSNPYPVMIAPGGCIAVRADEFHDIGAFDEGLLPPWGAEDTELSFRYWRAGFKVVTVPTCGVRTLYRSAHPYVGVTATAQLHNTLRVAFKHLDWPDVEQVLRAYHADPSLPSALVKLFNSDIMAAREAAKSLRSGSWLLERFGVTLRQPVLQPGG